MGTTESLATAEFRQVIDTNLVGVFLGMRAVVPSMRRAGGGAIVHIKSITGLAPAPGLAACAASKWGIQGLTLTAAKELAPDNIRVNGVHPGIIETPLAYHPATGAEILPVGNFAIPPPRLSRRDQQLILFAASEESAFSTGTEIVADGGFLLGAMAA